MFVDDIKYVKRSSRLVKSTRFASFQKTILRDIFRCLFGSLFLGNGRLFIQADPAG